MRKIRPAGEVAQDPAEAVVKAASGPATKGAFAQLGVVIPTGTQDSLMEHWDTLSDEEKAQSQVEWNRMSDEQKKQALESLKGM